MFTCQICHANGNDMRTLTARWLVDFNEYIKEFTFDGESQNYKLKTCKTCRALMLEALAEVCKERRELRKYELTPDGDEILTRYVLKGEKQ